MKKNLDDNDDDNDDNDDNDDKMQSDRDAAYDAAMDAVRRMNEIYITLKNVVCCRWFVVDF